MAFVTTGHVVGLHRNSRYHGGCAATPMRNVGGQVVTRASKPRAVVLRMMQEKEGGESQAQQQQEQGQGQEPEQQRKPEPYPGYYRDLEASGASEIGAAKKELKVGGRKSLLRPDGRPYAPWMRFREEDLDYKPSQRKKKTEARGRLAGDPQQQELAGTGLRAKFLGDELELSWQTGDETGNAGFILSRRRGKEARFETVADYKSDPATLKSKGDRGGSYSYVCEKPESGSWVYRISDVDTDGAVSDLSQTMVEVESEEDQQKQRIALIIFVVLAVILAAFGFLADPESGL